uniref:Uncharacterized protein n=1 Tax=Palpitomonas bilix TaxID=652834 RepID=A0A7S3CV99_9EUKA|mmetsp:Transcript_10757/g.28209  ORF Transcript_10757/g.28209 Transcript_10757/m.28209 type:complete len:253 (+) Transcript_10757:75-833(+)
MFRACVFRVAPLSTARKYAVQNLQQTATPRFCAQLRQVARYCKEAPQTVVKETKTVAETAAAPAASGATSGAASKLDVSSRMAGLKNMSNPLRFFKKKELSAEEKLLKEYEIPQTAYWLGFAGLIPFLGTTAGVAMFPSDWSSKSLTLQLTYGSSILGFMGAVHWGLAMAQYKASRNVLRYTISVVPALIGWGAVSMYALDPKTQTTNSLLILAGSFVSLYGVDKYYHMMNKVPKVRSKDFSSISSGVLPTH